MLDLPHLVALSIFVSYFLLILTLFSLIVVSIRKHARFSDYPRRALLFGGLALASFAHTWYWLIRFMAWSFHGAHTDADGPLLLSIAAWLKKTALFKQAWAAACAGPLQWWWSEQLCLFTAGAFTVFLFMHRERVPYAWAYMALGQLVAISVAFALFNLALALIPPRKAQEPAPRLPLTLTAPVLLSLFTVSLSPYTTSATFLPNLLAMHALLLLPLLLPPRGPAPLAPRATSFYTLVALLGALLRMRTTLAVLSALRVTSSPFFSAAYPVDVLAALWNAPGMLYGAAWETLHAHPAQASIGWDVVWTSMGWLVWGGEVLQVFPTVVASVGVVAPMGFGRALREESEEKARMEKVE